MKTTPLLLLLALTSCTVSHVIGDGTHQSALACGGFAGTPCAGSEICVDDPSDSCDPAHGGADCPGICKDPQGACAGDTGASCPSGETCVDDPSDNCDPAHGGADCPGVCVTGGTPDAGNPPPDAGAVTHCGGFAGTACPGGQDCVDDPSDSCDPANGGADCPGICVPNTTCGADPCGACPTDTVPHDTCSNGAWQCTCLALCQKSNPDDCNICPAGQTNLVSSNGACVCECQLPATTSQCTQDSDCHAGNPDVCNICAAPLNHLVCSSGTCKCGCS
jgi:hypothetical protein